MPTSLSRWSAGLALAATLIASPVSAATFGTGDQYSLANGQSVEDSLYVGAGNATVSGDVDGDLFVGGGNILVTGHVRDDLFAAGGTVNVLGSVGDDARIAGGNVTIGESVDGDLIVAGGTVHLTPDAVIGGDVIAAGGKITIDGTVNGNLKIMGGMAEINGSVLGSVDATTSDGSLTVGSKASIQGSLLSRGRSAPVITTGAKIKGEVRYEPMTRNMDHGRAPKNFILGAIGFGLMLKFMAMLTAALVVTYVFKSATKRLVDTALINKGRHMLQGLGLLFLAPIVIGLLLISLVGSLLGIAALPIFAALIFAAHIYVGIVLGAWIWRLTSPRLIKNAPISWPEVLVGVFLFSLLSLIPILGWAVASAVYLMTLGAIYERLMERFRQAR